MEGTSYMNKQTAFGVLGILNISVEKMVLSIL